MQGDNNCCCLSSLTISTHRAKCCKHIDSFNPHNNYMRLRVFIDSKPQLFSPHVNISDIMHLTVNGLFIWQYFKFLMVHTMMVCL